MANLSLATKYRPKVLSEICEQDSIKTILEKYATEKNFGNSALFTGPAGCGKTTAARAFARQINNFNGNPIEIDGASNNGVENVRDILVKAQQRAMDCEYKIFIIDECHALSNAAWQAMLKILEEPPKNTIFLFCTTDPQKIPNTILSRVQRFDFKRISFDTIKNRLKYIINEENKLGENITYTEEAISYIAKACAGGMRDGITSLDKCIGYSKNLTIESVVSALGSVDYNILFKLTNSLIDCEESTVIDIIEKTYQDGADLKQFVKQEIYFLLDIHKYILFKNFDYIQIPDNYREDIERLIEGLQPKYIKYFLEECSKLSSNIKWESQVRQAVEIAFLDMCKD